MTGCGEEMRSELSFKQAPGATFQNFTYPPHKTKALHTIMASKSLARIGNTSLRCCFRASIAYQASARRFTPRLSIASSPQWSASAIRSFHSSMVTRGILPHDENPPPKESEDSESPTVPTDISTTEYHKLADNYLADLVAKLEAEQDKRQDLEVEYSVYVICICDEC